MALTRLSGKSERSTDARRVQLSGADQSFGKPIQIGLRGGSEIVLTSPDAGTHGNESQTTFRSVTSGELGAKQVHPLLVTMPRDSDNPHKLSESCLRRKLSSKTLRAGAD